MLTAFADEQAMFQVSRLKAPQAYKNDVNLLSQQLDEKVSTLYFPALGAALNVEPLVEEISACPRRRALEPIRAERSSNGSCGAVTHSSPHAATHHACKWTGRSVCVTQRYVRLTRGPCSPDGVQCSYSNCAGPSMTGRSPWSQRNRRGHIPRCATNLELHRMA